MKFRAAFFRVSMAAAWIAVLWPTASALGQDAAAPAAGSPPRSFLEIIHEGGACGYVIIALSIAALAVVIEHIITVRRSTLMPVGLAEEVHQLIGQGNAAQAEQQCKLRPSFLGYVLSAGLAEFRMGYPAVEKSMEEASQEQAARLFRKIEYLSVIGNLAPMLGLLGTVWGMIEAFMEFERTPNPQVSQLAPGIYKALITTVMGLVVAIPVLGMFAILRNRVDELVAETVLLAEHVFSQYKRGRAGRRSPEGAAVAEASTSIRRAE
jgi:biopolymer transport protein ExbB